MERRSIGDAVIDGAHGQRLSLLLYVSIGDTAIIVVVSNNGVYEPWLLHFLYCGYGAMEHGSSTCPC